MRRKKKEHWKKVGVKHNSGMKLRCHGAAFDGCQKHLTTRNQVMSDYDRYEYECRDKRENTLPEGIIMYAISDPCKGIKDPCKNGGVCISPKPEWERVLHHLLTESDLQLN